MWDRAHTLRLALAHDPPYILLVHNMRAGFLCFEAIGACRTNFQCTVTGSPLRPWVRHSWQQLYSLGLHDSTCLPSMKFASLALYPIEIYSRLVPLIVC